MRLIYIPFLISYLFIISCTSPKEQSTNINDSSNAKSWVRGINILSDSLEMGQRAVKASSEFGVNHLQISHHLIMDLKDVRDEKKLRVTRELISDAREQNIEKVFVWDHALYHLEYYPNEFKTEEGLINLDNPEFWKWIKDDYRSMLDSLSDLNGIILTFIETGAHVEDQYSEKLKTESDKLAALVDTLATVIIDERNMDFYIRTFIYSQSELKSMIGCVNQIKHPDIKVMTKEVPHDFFLPHPVSNFIEDFDKEVLIEFDLTHEYSGQGIIASILPEVTIKRWKHYAANKNVIGNVARTDRFHDTQIIGTPTELNLFTLDRISADTSLTAVKIVSEYIEKRYGKDLVPHLKDVFLESDDIITSVLYTLGINASNHSRFGFEHPATFSRHCSGNWLSEPVVEIGHDVNKEFHYWKDIVEHLAPPKFKTKYKESGDKTIMYTEMPWLIEEGIVSEKESMNEEYLSYIISEKEYGINKAEWAVNNIKKAKSLFKTEKDYNQLLYQYERTHLLAVMYLNASKVYFGTRCKVGGKESENIDTTIAEGKEGLQKAIEAMEQYPFYGASGQFSWRGDIEMAKEFYAIYSNSL